MVFGGQMRFIFFLSENYKLQREKLYFSTQTRFSLQFKKLDVHVCLL